MYQVGTIVEFMTPDFSIFKCIIVEINPVNKYKGRNKKFEYRGFVYPEGFIGIDNVMHFNEANIYGVLYNPQKTKESSNKEMGTIGSIVIKDNEEYMIVGINAYNLSSEDVIYNCIYLNNPNVYEIYNLKKEEVKVKEYGYLDQEILEFNKNRIKEVKKRLRYSRKLLPLGSTVILEIKEKGKIEVVIIDRDLNNKGERIDYIGVAKEVGYRKNEELLYFNRNQIQDISSLGHWDEKEVHNVFDILIGRGDLDGGK